MILKSFPDQRMVRSACVRVLSGVLSPNSQFTYRGVAK
jgi:hypothetical protein